jgi:hypothetical protein
MNFCAWDYLQDYSSKGNRVIERNSVRVAVAFLGVVSLSACVGNGNAAGGGAAAGGAAAGGTAYDQAYSAIINSANPSAGKIPTSDMPTSGTANYVGQTQLTMRDAGAGSSEIGKLTGDINLATSFSPTGNTPITGTASNFQFVANDGSVHAVDGTLTADSSLSAFAVNVQPAQTILGHTIPELRTGSGALYYTGKVGGLVDGSPASADVVLSGGVTAFGSGGESLAGQVALQSGSVTTGVNPIYGTGTAYLNKQP